MTFEEEVAEDEASELQVMVQNGDVCMRLGVTEFLTGVVAGQISVDYEMETIKAQAIIARTILYNRADNRTYIDASETGLDWRSESERRTEWGDAYETYNERAMKAVMETDGMALYYEDSLIVPTYFASGSGITRSSEEAWNLTVPWLVSVESAWDADSVDCETVVTMTRRQLIAKLKSAVDDFDCSPSSLASTFQITETDSAGYVLWLQAGNKLMSGEDFRYALGLPSACFSVIFDGNTATITVRGSGHGVGFDQYGANWQAIEGKSCEELLTYYLTGVKVCE